MKLIKTIKPNNDQAPQKLWTPLPECHQELLSGGAPKSNGGR